MVPANCNGYEVIGAWLAVPVFRKVEPSVNGREVRDVNESAQVPGRSHPGDRCCRSSAGIHSRPRRGARAIHHAGFRAAARTGTGVPTSCNSESGFLQRAIRPSVGFSSPSGRIGPNSLAKRLCTPTERCRAAFCRNHARPQQSACLGFSGSALEPGRRATTAGVACAARRQRPAGIRSCVSPRDDPVAIILRTFEPSIFGRFAPQAIEGRAVLEVQLSCRELW
jgi:hypothetical protein